MTEFATRRPHDPADAPDVPSKKNLAHRDRTVAGERSEHGEAADVSLLAGFCHFSDWLRSGRKK